MSYPPVHYPPGGAPKPTARPPCGSGTRSEPLCSERYLQIWEVSPARRLGKAEDYSLLRERWTVPPRPPVMDTDRGCSGGRF